MEEDKGVIQGWQWRRWGSSVSGIALTRTCDQQCPGLSYSGLGKQTATARGKTALPFTPPTAGALWLPVTVPLHWANASRDTPSSEQLSVCPGKGQEQGKAMSKGEMCWPWSCSWLETDTAVCPSALPGALEVLDKQSRSFRGMVRTGNTGKSLLGWYHCGQHQFPQSPCHFPNGNLQGSLREVLPPLYGKES